MKKKVGFGARVKESVRKFIVSLKHRPHNIPLVMLVITFLYYALNMTYVSNTTAKVNLPFMGLCGFTVMLLSILSLVCFGNAFPRRKPVNVPMLVLMFLMFAAIFFADITYRSAILTAVTRAESPIAITEETRYIPMAFNCLYTHMILLGISTALIVLLPVYSKLIRKIKTSIEVAGSGEMEAIDISGEE